MNATRSTFGRACRERDWSKKRLEYELQNGLPYWIVRHPSVPPNHVINWHDDYVLKSLDVEASTVTLVLGGEVVGPAPDLDLKAAIARARERINVYGNVVDPPIVVTVGIEIMLPAAGAMDEGRQATRVRMALDRLRDRGLVLSDHLRPELRRRIGNEIDAEARRTGSSDPAPSRQVVDKVLKSLGVK